MPESPWGEGAASPFGPREQVSRQTIVPAIAVRLPRDQGHSGRVGDTGVAARHHRQTATLSPDGARLAVTTRGQAYTLAHWDGPVLQHGVADLFDDVGWGVENRGTEPDIEVDNAPHDYARGADPQLERAITEALAEVARREPAASRCSPSPCQEICSISR